MYRGYNNVLFLKHIFKIVINFTSTIELKIKIV